MCKTRLFHQHLKLAHMVEGEVLSGAAGAQDQLHPLIGKQGEQEKHRGGLLAELLEDVKVLRVGRQRSQVVVPGGDNAMEDVRLFDRHGKLLRSLEVGAVSLRGNHLERIGAERQYAAVAEKRPAKAQNDVDDLSVLLCRLKLADHLQHGHWAVGKRVRQTDWDVVADGAAAALSLLVYSPYLMGGSDGQRQAGRDVQPSRLLVIEIDVNVTARLGDLVVALEAAQDGDFRRNVWPDHSATLESNLVNRFQIGGIDQREVQPPLVLPKGNHLVTLRQLPGNGVDHLLRYVVQLFSIDCGDVALLAQKAGEKLFGDEAMLDQVGAQLASVDQLSVERLLQLVAGEDARFHQQLADSQLLRHCRSAAGRRRSRGIADGCHARSREITETLLRPAPCLAEGGGPPPTHRACLPPKLAAWHRSTSARRRAPPAPSPRPVGPSGNPMPAAALCPPPLRCPAAVPPSAEAAQKSPSARRVASATESWGIGRRGARPDVSASAQLAQRRGGCSR